MTQSPVEYPAFISHVAEAMARVEPAELSRFEGEGGPEAPEHATHILKQQDHLPVVMKLKGMDL